MKGVADMMRIGVDVGGTFTDFCMSGADGRLWVAKTPTTHYDLAVGFMKGLKQLAREINVPVLAGAQLSRAVEQRQDKRPMLSDLRESGSLEQDADIVMFIHRPDPEKEAGRHGIAEIIVAKHRNGPTHSGVELVFLEKLAKFENAARVDLRSY